jgi:30S ribosomal protein S31
MGRGDRRSRKGKIFRGSYGNSRPHREVRLAAVRAPAAAVAVAPAKLSRTVKKPAK